MLTEDDASRLASANVREFVLPRIASRGGGVDPRRRRSRRRRRGGVQAVIVRRGAKRGRVGRLGGAHGRGRHPQSTRGGRRGGARRSRIETGGAVAGVETEGRRAAQGAVLPGSRARPTRWKAGCRRCSRGSPRWPGCSRGGKRRADALAYTRQRVTSPIPNAFLVVPNELERSVGWPTEYTPPGTEMTSFALRCQDKGARFAWLDAGVRARHPGAVALFRSRVRDHAGALLLMGEDVALSAERKFPGTDGVSRDSRRSRPCSPRRRRSSCTNRDGGVRRRDRRRRRAPRSRGSIAVRFASRAARGTSRGARRDTSSIASSSRSPSRSSPLSRSSNSRRCAPRRCRALASRGKRGRQDPSGNVDVGGGYLGRVSARIGRGGASMGGARKGGAARGRAGRTPTRARARGRRGATAATLRFRSRSTRARGRGFDEPSAPATSPPTAARASAAAASAARKEMMDAERRAWSSRKSRSRSTIGSVRSGGSGGDGSEAGGSNVERWFGSPGGRSGASRHSRENDDRR